MARATDAGGGAGTPRPGRPLWRLGLLLYPFAAAAVAINLFMLSLMGQAIGLPVLSPAVSVAWSIALGVPAAWLAARWVRRLIAEAEDD
ncbi:hypothetical protein [Rhodobium gokarnense]|uniref:Membrane protein implicated in regulation of membrane protease activity n=1 Tax=Rhodobium gokarnense TaxID=364296 RepID=A0ABT3HBK3_9HYPH|nr:hypothetical protein [Rhodobium gokarnense]MCW2307724.1 membrane protein implicated in regulation of membrane protease activity [Rhodobium gokarnense]